MKSTGPQPCRAPFPQLPVIVSYTAPLSRLSWTCCSCQLVIVGLEQPAGVYRTLMYGYKRHVTLLSYRVVDELQQHLLSNRTIRCCGWAAHFIAGLRSSNYCDHFFPASAEMPSTDNHSWKQTRSVLVIIRIQCITHRYRLSSLNRHVPHCWLIGHERLHTCTQ